MQHVFRAAIQSARVNPAPKKGKTLGFLPAPPCFQVKTFRIAAIARRHAAQSILMLMVTVVRFHMGVTPFLDHAGAAHEGCGERTIEGLARPSWQHRTGVSVSNRLRRTPLDSGFRRRLSQTRGATSSRHGPRGWPFEVPLIQGGVIWGSRLIRTLASRAGETQDVASDVSYSTSS